MLRQISIYGSWYFVDRIPLATAVELKAETVRVDRAVVGEV